MRYFELVADQDIANPVQIEKVDGNIYKNGISEEEFAAIAPLTVGYFDNSPRIEIYDVLQEPAFLVSDRLKRLFALFEPKMAFKGIQLFPVDMEDKTAPLYWLPYTFPLDCLSGKARKYPNGMLEQMILDSNTPITHDIFRVDGIFEHKIIVSLPVAESMIRRKISGITFVPAAFGEERGKDGKK